MQRWFVIVLILLTFSGCDQPRETVVESNETPLEPVSLQLQWVTQTQFAGFYVALDKGWYKDEGLDLTIHQGGPDSIPVDMVSALNRDFGTALLADLAVSIQKGKPVIGISQLQQTGGLRLLAKSSSGISKPEDFKGKRVGVWLGSWEIQFTALLAAVGVSPKDVDVVSQGWSINPFISGELDVASAMIYNEYNRVLETGIEENELNVIDYADYDLDFPGDVIFTSTELMEKKPGVCKKFLRASYRGWQYAMEHPEEAAEIILRYDKAGIQEYDHQLKMMKEVSKLVKYGGGELGSFDPERVERMVKLLVQYGILSEALPLSKVVTEECYRDLNVQ